MTLNIPAGYFELAFHHHASGSTRDAVCTLGVHYTGADIVTDFNTVATAWGTTMVAEMADAWTYDFATIRDQLGHVATHAAGVAGGTAHSAATVNTAFLFKKTTGLGGRKNHGRMYLPGVSEQDVDVLGIVAGSKITALTTAFGNFISALIGAHMSVQLLHNGPTADPSLGPAPTTVTDMTVEDTAATQRRRMRK